MPTIITHALVPLAAGLALGPKRIGGPVVALSMMLAMLPDADVIGFRLGIAYADDWGHRGANHALATAAVTAVLFYALWPRARSSQVVAFLAFSMASHGLLDCLTSGGLGVALLWPFDTGRYFAPWRPVRVSPIGMSFFSDRGLATAWSEFAWIWIPCVALAVVGPLWRRMKTMPEAAPPIESSTL